MSRYLLLAVAAALAAAAPLLPYQSSTLLFAACVSAGVTQPPSPRPRVPADTGGDSARHGDIRRS